MAIKEIRSLTGVRGVAALYVSIFHYYQFYIAQSPRSNQGLINNSYIQSLFIHGYLAVDLFFILSAFVITLTSHKLFEGKITKENYTLFMKRRWIRIYPAFFFVSIYGFVIVEHGHRIPNFLITLTLLNLVFGLSFILGHLWSLGAEWITYLLYPLFLKITFFSSFNTIWNYFLIGIGTILLYLLGSTIYKGAFPPFMLEIYQGYPCLLRCFANYILGIAAFGLFKQNKSDIFNKNVSALIILILLLTTLLFQRLDVISVVLFVFFILSIAKDNNIITYVLGSKVVYFLGEISYPLYLINSLVFSELDKIKTMVEHLTVGKYVYSILFIVFIALNISLSYLFSAFLEKPIIKYLGKRLKTSKPFLGSSSLL